jgi:hypothetical protein
MPMVVGFVDSSVAAMRPRGAHPVSRDTKRAPQNLSISRRARRVTSCDTSSGLLAPAMPMSLSPLHRQSSAGRGAVAPLGLRSAPARTSGRGSFRSHKECCDCGAAPRGGRTRSDIPRSLPRRAARLLRPVSRGPRKIGTRPSLTNERAQRKGHLPGELHAAIDAGINSPIVSRL